ncbi:hypothetical protein BC936DRAFT_137618, partial [Jimgerdemannia flammicorona]
MTDIKLNCLVLGENPDDKTFPITIDKNLLIGELKEAIKGKKFLTFAQTEANMINLWKVLIPTDDDEDAKYGILSEGREVDIEEELEGEKPKSSFSIARYWPAPPQSHIHVIVKGISRQLTERRLLMLRPPSLSYTSDSQRKKKSKTTTKSNWARTPVSVIHWQNFIHQAGRMALDDTTPQYDEPTF